jgi:broad specificity phosphatase PhoE
LKGPQDLELNENGRHQAEGAYQLVVEHKSIRNPIIYSSSLQRAYETATIFAKKLPEKTTIKQVDGLKERYYGDYSQALPHSVSDYKPTDAESTDTFQRRVRESLIEILKNPHSDERELIVVSHQKVFEFLTEWLSHTKLKLEQGGVCCFKFHDGTYSAEIYESSSSDSSSSDLSD